jgi:hypothetical protein
MIPIPNKTMGDSNFPRTPIRWPNLSTVTRQIQSSAQPVQVSNQRHVASINQPLPVTGVFVNIRRSGLQRRVTVSFIQRTADTNYQKANIHLKLGSGPPVMIASGVSSPVVISVPASTLPATVFVQAEGNWGPHPLNLSPSRSISLV